METSAAECARALLEAVPVLMRELGSHLRADSGVNLSVTQFRALAFLRRNEGASISVIADHLEIALPSMSRLIDGLVIRGMVRRQPHASDRRRVTLALTPAGRAALQDTRRAAEAYLTAALTGLSPSGRATVAQAMRVLQGVFAREREPIPAGNR